MITIREGETILATYRRHAFVLVLEIFPIAFGALILIAGLPFALSYLPAQFDFLIPLILLGVAFMLHFLMIALFTVLADFFLDVWILTDARVIAVEQGSLFSRTVSEFELGKIQDATVNIHGIIPTLLNYGNLNLRTASEHEHFIFKQIWHPQAAKDEIVRACLAERTARERVANDVSLPKA